ncbi:MAG: chemotaxis protein CheW [Alphaproteobacteria bacterium]
MDDLLSEFLTESAESLATLDVELVKLEQNPEPALISSIFRLVHTIKGTCGFIGLPRLETLAHSAENVLGKIRDGELEVTSDAVSLILLSIDKIKEILAVIEQTEAEPAGDDAELIARLDALAEGKSAPPVAEPAPPAKPATKKKSPGRGRLNLRSDAAPETEAPGVEDAAAPAEPVAQTVTDEQAREVADKLVAEAAGAAGGESSIANQSIRVSVQLLENLMTTVSELVLTRNQLLQMIRSVDEDSEFKVPLQRLSHITTDLQEGVMKTRMQPIGNAWAKLPRIVRSLAHDLGKKIDLEMVGAETELDRQVLELIKDPLTHMVRNSGDHGLETPAERKAAGKPETGKVRLNAYHEGGHIIIQVSDDGRGIDIARVRAKAVENGLASEAELDGMAEKQILQFIFRAGFSTAKNVTSVSGRGVGMDVVRTNIEKIGGTIELSTAFGKGSVFTIKIPLTLAIVSALIVEVAGERFAIPQIAVVELVRTTSDSEHNKIEVINGTPVLRLRNRLLPLVSLAQSLGLGGAAGEAAVQGAALGEAFIVVTQVGTYSFGIIVDRVFDTEEIVVKPVSPILRNISMFSGNTILGDGSVIMILDPNGIAANSGQRHASEDFRESEAARSRVPTSQERTALLLFRAASDTPKAVPLSLVARLEEIEVGSIERSDGRPVVQYRGQLMPLVSVDPSQEIRAEGRQPVLVFADRARSMGLIVDEIIDIVEEHLDFEVASQHTGLLGSAVVNGKATDVIDVACYLQQASSDWFQQAPPSGRDAGRRLLLVDDSPFFRNMLTPVLTAAGYQVTAAADADEALRLLDEETGFDVIVSDIEMPGKNGFEFARACRTSDRWAGLPIVALSSRTEPADFDRGREAGFTDYVAKFDRDALLSALNQSLELVKGAA